MTEHDPEYNWWTEFTEDGSVSFTETDAMSRRERWERKLDAIVVVPAKIMWEDWRARVGLVIIAVYVLGGLIGPSLVARPSPTGPRLVKPFESMAYPLGTDGLGQDIFSYIVYSTPPILLMILGGAVTATVVAFTTGVLAGYKGGAVDTVLVNFIDMVIAVPGFPLIIVVVAIFQPRSPLLIGVVMSVNAWAGLARMIRAETLAIRENNYVQASQVMGLSTPRIILKDCLPNLAPYVTMHFVGMARRVIFHSVALFFLGVLPYMEYNWGLMMDSAYQMGVLYTWDIAHWLVMPMLAIVFLTIGLTLVAQSLDNVFNPRIRARHADNDDTDPTTPIGGYD